MKFFHLLSVRRIFYTQFPHCSHSVCHKRWRVKISWSLKKFTRCENSAKFVYQDFLRERKKEEGKNCVFNGVTAMKRWWRFNESWEKNEMRINLNWTQWFSLLCTNDGFEWVFEEKIEADKFLFKSLKQNKQTFDKIIKSPTQKPLSPYPHWI
jgi:hypothetical protein